jgi:hypothetical protein
MKETTPACRQAGSAQRGLFLCVLKENNLPIADGIIVSSVNIVGIGSFSVIGFNGFSG